MVVRSGVVDGDGVMAGAAFGIVLVLVLDVQVWVEERGRRRRWELGGQRESSSGGGSSPCVNSLESMRKLGLWSASYSVVNCRLPSIACGYYPDTGVWNWVVSGCPGTAGMSWMCGGWLLGTGGADTWYPGKNPFPQFG